jgi:hypothetical protein
MNIAAPQPQGDLAHDRVASYKFNREVRQYVLGQLREEWHSQPRSLARCVSLSYALCQNFCATLMLWTADVVEWLKGK